VAPLGHLGQADGTGLVGVEQALVGATDPFQPDAKQLIRRALTVGSGLHGGKVRELRHQPCRIGEQARDVVPDHGLDFLGLDVAARAAHWSGGQDTVLPVALVEASLPLARGCLVGAAEHRQATGLAGEQAAQQVVVLRVVPE
jgi:hypothetical protein